jgi:hypothetical protein
MASKITFKPKQITKKILSDLHEDLGATNEVGLASNLYESSFLAVACDEDTAFGLDTVGLLHSLGFAALAEDIDGEVLVAVCFLKGVLSVQDTATRAGAKLGDLFSGDRHC